MRLAVASRCSTKAFTATSSSPEGNAFEDVEGAGVSSSIRASPLTLCWTDDTARNGLGGLAAASLCLRECRWSAWAFSELKDLL